MCFKSLEKLKIIIYRLTLFLVIRYYKGFGKSKNLI